MCIHCTRTYRGQIDFDGVAAATQGLCLLCAQAGAEALHTGITTSVCSSRPPITPVLGASVAYAMSRVVVHACTQHTDIGTHGGRSGTAEALTAPPPPTLPTTFPAAASPAAAHLAVPAPGDALAAGVAAAAAVPVVAPPSNSVFAEPADPPGVLPVAAPSQASAGSVATMFSGTAVGSAPGSAFLSPAAASSAASEGLPAAPDTLRRPVPRDMRAPAEPGPGLGPGPGKRRKWQVTRRL